MFRVLAAELVGASVAGWNDLGVQRGLTIGLYNSADRLEGIQIGLINRAGNNRRFEVLPFFNAHFEYRAPVTCVGPARQLRFAARRNRRQS